MDLEPEEIIPVGTTILPSFVRRLASLLPYRTGYTVEETESQTLFISGRESLKKFSRQGVFDELLLSLVDIIVEISQNDRSPGGLATKSTLNLNSILILTRVMAECTCSAWDSVDEDHDANKDFFGNDLNPLDPPNPPKPTFVPTFNKSSSSSSASKIASLEDKRVYRFLGRRDFHIRRPKAINKDVARKAAIALLKIKPAIRVEAALVFIKSPKTSNFSGSEPTSSLSEILQEIDANCEQTLLFLSASNWTEFYPLVVERLNIVKQATSSESEFMPMMDIFSLLFLENDRIMVVLKDLWTAFPHIRKQSHRLLIEHFFQYSLVYWYICKSPEILQAISCPEDAASSILTTEASGFFDYLYGLDDNDSRHPITLSLLGTLLPLIPKTFNDSRGPAPQINPPTASTQSSTSSLGSSYSGSIPFQSKPVSPSSFRSSSYFHKLKQSKKEMFLNQLYKDFESSTPGRSILASVSYIQIILAISSMSVYNPNCPGIDFVKKLYPHLLYKLFRYPEAMFVTYPYLNDLQFLFTICSLFAKLDNVAEDFAELVSSKNLPQIFVQNILKAMIKLRGIVS